jgi:hypothetical protein
MLCYCYVNSLTFHYSFYLCISRHNTFQVWLKTDDLSFLTFQSFLNQLRLHYPIPRDSLHSWDHRSDMHAGIAKTSCMKLCKSVGLPVCTVLDLGVRSHGNKLKALSVHAPSVRRFESYGWSGLVSDEYLRGRVKVSDWDWNNTVIYHKAAPLGNQQSVAEGERATHRTSTRYTQWGLWGRKNHHPFG